MKKAIAYYRVSTEEQELSGLGLSAQAEAISRFAVSENYTVIAEFTEQQSGKNNKRPIMLAALARCKKERATLIVARLDRLSRSVAFTAKLIESGADFRAVDMPTADKMQLQIRAVFNEYERDVISQRTKAALAALKRREVKLGVHGAEVLSRQNAAAAVQFANDMRPIIQEINTAGIKTVRAIKDELNRRGVKPFRGKNEWCQTSVFNLLKRI